MTIINAIDYRNKGNHAYLAALTLEKGKVTKREYYNPTSFANDRHYAGKSCDCVFDLEKMKFPDGYAHLRDGRHASAHEDNRYYLIRDREIIEEFETLDDLLLHAFPVAELPLLEGSPRQIAWAESIRSRCFQAGIEADYSNVSVKYWIDNFK